MHSKIIRDRTAFLLKVLFQQRSHPVVDNMRLSHICTHNIPTKCKYYRYRTLSTELKRVKCM